MGQSRFSVPLGERKFLWYLMKGYLIEIPDTHDSNRQRAAFSCSCLHLFLKRYCCNMKASLRLKIIFNVLFVDLLQMNWRKVQEHTILSPNALTCVLMTQIQRLLLLKLMEGLLAMPLVIWQQQKHGTMDSAIEIIRDPIKQVRT